MIATSDKPVTKPVMKAKRTPNDFKFGALIGEGSFSSVIINLYMWLYVTVNVSLLMSLYVMHY